MARGTGWQRERLGRDRSRSDYYGMAGVVFDSAGRDARAEIATLPGRGVRDSDRIVVWFQRQEKGGLLQVYLDGKLAGTIRTQGAYPQLGRATFEVNRALQRVELRAVVGLSVRVYGVVFETDDPGVIVDNAALGGSKFRYHLKSLDPVYSQQLRSRKPDLLMVAYGGNEGSDFGVSINKYARRTQRMLGRLRRTVPTASCLLVGPLDKPLRQRSGWVHRHRTTSIARVQRRLAASYGCAFFDSVAFMGGRLSMLGWVEAMPPLARQDHVHLSRSGYHRLGRGLLSAILKWGEM